MPNNHYHHLVFGDDALDRQRRNGSYVAYGRQLERGDERWTGVAPPRALANWPRMVAALAVQGARLVWTVVTPVTPLGEWRPAGPTGGRSAGGHRPRR